MSAVPLGARAPFPHSLTRSAQWPDSNRRTRIPEEYRSGRVGGEGDARARRCLLHAQRHVLGAVTVGLRAGPTPAERGDRSASRPAAHHHRGPLQRDGRAGGRRLPDGRCQRGGTRLRWRRAGAGSDARALRDRRAGRDERAIRSLHQGDRLPDGGGAFRLVVRIQAAPLATDRTAPGEDERGGAGALVDRRPRGALGSAGGPGARPARPGAAPRRPRLLERCRRVLRMGRQAPAHGSGVGVRRQGRSRAGGLPLGGRAHARRRHRCNIWQGAFPDHDTGGDGFTATAPVDSFEPNGFGLYNCSGNVWEWTADWFSPDHHRTEEAATRNNPAGPPGARTASSAAGRSSATSRTATATASRRARATRPIRLRRTPASAASATCRPPDYCAITLPRSSASRSSTWSPTSIRTAAIVPEKANGTS